MSVVRSGIGLWLERLPDSETPPGRRRLAPCPALVTRACAASRKLVGCRDDVVQVSAEGVSGSQLLAELEAKGAEFTGGVEDFGFGLAAMLKLPGAGEIMIYQPRHPEAHSL